MLPGWSRGFNRISSFWSLLKTSALKAMRDKAMHDKARTLRWDFARGSITFSWWCVLQNRVKAGEHLEWDGLLEFNGMRELRTWEDTLSSVRLVRLIRACS